MEARERVVVGEGEAVEERAADEDSLQEAVTDEVIVGWGFLVCLSPQSWTVPAHSLSVSH